MSLFILSNIVRRIIGSYTQARQKMLHLIKIFVVRNYCEIVINSVFPFRFFYELIVRAS